MKSLIFRAAISQNWAWATARTPGLTIPEASEEWEQARSLLPRRQPAAKQQGREEPRRPLATLSGAGPFCLQVFHQRLHHLNALSRR